MQFRLSPFRPLSAREALREHLRRLEIREMEDRERRAYQTTPDKDEFRPMQRITAWPKD